MKITDEQKERANTANLPEFLMSHGFDLKRVGKEYVWKEHDSLHIKDNRSGERGGWFRFSENKGGDNIGFLREYMGMSFSEAVEALTGEHIDRSFAPQRRYETKPEQPKAKELSIAEADNCRRVFAYLCKTRGLDYDMLSPLVRKDVISQEEKTGNVLFKYFDTEGKVIGAEKIGTSTEHKFKGIATGSAGGHGFEVVRGTGEKAFFFESAIDMLSYLQMYDKELDNCRLVSMMGVKPNIVLDTMLRNGIPPKNVFLCSDNDTAGNEFAERLREQYPEMNRIATPDTYKDWNDMLRGIPKEIERGDKTKEADNVTDLELYGNKLWNDATDNRQKALVNMRSGDFMRVRDQLERSGMNYYAYNANGIVRMAVNDKDVDWLKTILGDVAVGKSNKPYSPPEKNILGNTEYRYIPDKQYVSAERDLILKMAEIMNRSGIHFSGRIYPSGKGTLTVSRRDLNPVRSIQNDVIQMRSRFAAAGRGQEGWNRPYSPARNTHYYMSKLTPEQFGEIKPYIETSVGYHAVTRDGNVAFAVEKENAAAFHRALVNAAHEANMIRSLNALGLSAEQMTALSPLVHRIAAEDISIDVSSFFDSRYDEAQFGEMLSLLNDYISQSPAEKNGEQSKMSEMLDAKNSFDRSIELSDFFSQHEFFNDQRAAITAMFVGDVTRAQIESIDETFTPDDIRAYEDVLHKALSESEVAEFLTAHKQVVTDREKALREPTEEEKQFMQADLARFLAKQSLSSDEWEGLAYPLFDNGYIDRIAPHDGFIFGEGISEHAVYDLARRFHDGEDIRSELAFGLMPRRGTEDIEFIFKEGELSTHTYFTAENLRNLLHVEYGEDSVICTFGNAEREFTYEKMGQTFLDIIREEFDDLAFWAVRDYIKDDISDDTVKQLITAFDGAVMNGWENDRVKTNRIKSALFDILVNEEQTEKAFACIAKHKYNVTVEPEKPKSSIHFGLLGNGITAYDVSRTDPETHDYPTVAHISAEGVIKIYDENISADDMERINAQAQSAREKFMSDWDKLSTEQQYQRLLDRADISTSVNISREQLSMEQTIEKYMPFVFFGEGERPEPEQEKIKATFHIYQLPAGEMYHGIRFAGMDELKAEGVQLNKDDYELVYEGAVDDFKGNATLEALYAQFNTDHPEDFRGHSLSMSDVIVISVDGKDTAYYCDTIGFTEMPEFYREKELTPEKTAAEEAEKTTGAKVFDLAVGDIIMYEDKLREVESISDNSISLKDLFAPTFGGVLLGTSDVLAYDGWQQDMERKGFEIVTKAERKEPAVDAPEKTAPEDKGPVSLRKVGDFYEMYGKNAEIGAEVLGLRMLSKNGSPMVGFPVHVKDEYSDKLRAAGYSVLIEQAFELNPPKREPEKLQTLQQVVDKFFGTDCEFAETEGGTWKLAIADGDKVGELFYGGEPVCGIYNRGDKMEIEPYRELSTFPEAPANGYA